jgi:CMP-N-acetylneuraminic acid synthetase
MRVLGVIPARGGSKGVPRKNIASLAGRPLLAYTASSALRASRLTRVIVSTEDPEIAEVARQAGLDVPFMRPVELAQDDTPTLPVIQHALRALASTGQIFDAVCILQPTSPLRGSNEIDDCIALLETSAADTVFSVRPVPAEYNPHWIYFRESDGSMRLSTGARMPIPRRQDLPPAFHRDGSVYVVRCEVVLEQNTLYGERTVGYVSGSEGHVNIDTLKDFERAELLLRGRA